MLSIAARTSIAAVLIVAVATVAVGQLSIPSSDANRLSVYGGYDRNYNTNNGGYGSASDYGGYGSASGYGGNGGYGGYNYGYNGRGSSYGQGGAKSGSGSYVEYAGAGSGYKGTPGWNNYDQQQVTQTYEPCYGKTCGRRGLQRPFYSKLKALQTPANSPLGTEAVDLGRAA